MSRFAIGVDIGGTKIKCILMDAKGNVRRSETIKTEVEKGFLCIEEQILQIINKLRKGLNVEGVGVGIPGQVDATGERVLSAHNLNWQNIPLKERWEKYLSLKVGITNDVRAATLGEWYQGAGRGCDDFICLFLGTGVGGGIVSGGHLITGNTNGAGEIGHMIVHDHGPLCTCGNSGCLEAVAGGWAIKKRAEENESNQFLLEKCRERKENITGKLVTECALAGDPVSIKIMQEAYQAIEIAVISLVNVFNPLKIIIGGGLSLGMPYLCDDLKKTVTKRALKINRELVQIVPAKLKENAGAIGAAQFVWNLCST